jgi:hypothetical protein
VQGAGGCSGWERRAEVQSIKGKVQALVKKVGFASLGDYIESMKGVIEVRRERGSWEVWENRVSVRVDGGGGARQVELRGVPAQFGMIGAGCVAAPAVWAVPEQADMPLSNERELRGRVVIVKEGRASFQDKALRCVEAGAVAVIVVAEEGKEPISIVRDLSRNPEPALDKQSGVIGSVVEREAEEAEGGEDVKTRLTIMLPGAPPSVIESLCASCTYFPISILILLLIHLLSILIFFPQLLTSFPAHFRGSRHIRSATGWSPHHRRPGGRTHHDDLSLCLSNIPTRLNDQHHSGA